MNEGRATSAENGHILTATSRLCSRDFLSHLDDDLAFCTSFFDVKPWPRWSIRKERPINNRPNNPGIDEATDLA